jgi:ankyrin repeat protein
VSQECIHDAVVRLLLDRGAGLNVANKNGGTTLHMAAANSNGAVAGLLLDSGADLNMADTDCWTLLHWAVQSSHEAIARLLLDRVKAVHRFIGWLIQYTILLHGSC